MCVNCYFLKLLSVFEVLDILYTVYVVYLCNKNIFCKSGKLPYVAISTNPSKVVALLKTGAYINGIDKVSI